MKVNKLRHRLHKEGLVLLQHGEGFTITDNGSKTPIEENFPNLEAVVKWHTDKHANRLNDIEALEWDTDWAKFVEENKGRYE